MNVFIPDDGRLANLRFSIEDGVGVWHIVGQLTDYEQRFLATIPATEVVRDR
ncbi:hypothetical protein [Pseudoalteromonas umbrosa]|uniref:hypothetical protein n=1 Tax=Pseudoalteromonas umbrosa TaxID=3048489 RepID=UPI0024C2C87E|nr:hypothetical protein [Pseudoalteromonas sp. B95]MDK1289828.1 hypothetical protein [Pseudoalteromonas sp. B95]